MKHAFTGTSGHGCTLADSHQDMIKEAAEALMILKQSPEALTSCEEGWGPWERRCRRFHGPATIPRTEAKYMEEDDQIADAEALTRVKSTASGSSACPTGNLFHDTLDSDLPIQPIRQIHTRRWNEADGGQEDSKNKNCHFCEHAPKQTALLACFSPTCNQIFCENCCVRHLGKPMNFKNQTGAKAAAWYCPLCTR